MNKSMTIIDVHTHLGWDHAFDEDFKLDYVLEKKDKYGVNIQIVQPGTCYDIDTAEKQHNAIAELCSKYPENFYGMANPNPTLSEEIYHREIDRCVNKLGFIAIKLHPMVFGINPSLQSSRKVFDAAKKHDIPIMVHTGAGFPFASPLNLLDPARKYPEVKIIMAHMGMITYAGEADIVMGSCSNIYGDTSWTPGFMLKNFVRKHGNRLMLGSDHADNLKVELSKIENSSFTEEEKNHVLSKTAKNIFKINS